MTPEQMLILKNLIEALSGAGEGIFYLNYEERRALQVFEYEVNQGEENRLYLLFQGRKVGLGPEHLLQLRDLA